MQPCIDRRLSELDVVFQRHDRGQPPGLIRRVGFPIAFEGSNGAWNLALSGGGPNHLPESEGLRFSSAFNGYGAWVRDILDERAIWHRLAVLDHPDALKDADWAMLRVALAEARASSNLTAHNFKFEGAIERTDGAQILNVGLIQGAHWNGDHDFVLWLTSDPFRQNHAQLVGTSRRIISAQQVALTEELGGILRQNGCR